MKNVSSCGKEQQGFLLVGILLLLFFAVKFYCQFRLGGLVSCTPDSVEPLTGALELTEGKRFGFQLNGVFYPSRYTPPLALLLYPGLLLSGGDLRSAGVCIGLFGLLIPGILFWMLRKEEHAGPGIFFCGLLMLYPCFCELCSMVMTEIPYTALLCAMLALFCRLAEKEEPDWRGFLLFGLLTAGAGSLRSSGYPMLAAPALLLFVRRKKGKTVWLCLVMLLLPVLLVIGASCWYNCAFFGSVLRSGYHYHCPVPYDYRELTFSLKYIVPNLKDFLFAGGRCVLVFAAGAGAAAGYLFFLFRKGGPEKRDELGAALFFILLQNVTLALLYFGHSFFSLRFFLPGGVLLLWFFCRFLIFLSEKISRSGRRIFQMASAGAGIFLMLLGFFHPVTDYCGREIRAMQFYHRHLPGDAVLIHDGEPGRCELFFRRNTRRIQQPSDCSVEYCSKIALPHRIAHPVPYPVYPGPHRAEFLLRAPERIDFFPQVFEESPNQILARRVSSGPCFVTGKALLKLPYARQLEMRRKYRWQTFCKAPSGDAVYRVTY